MYYLFSKRPRKRISKIMCYIKGGLKENRLLFFGALISIKNIHVRLGVPGEPTTSMISEIPFCFAVSLSVET